MKESITRQSTLNNSLLFHLLLAMKSLTRDNSTFPLKGILKSTTLMTEATTELHSDLMLKYPSLSLTKSHKDHPNFTSIKSNCFLNLMHLPKTIMEMYYRTD